ncbi:tetratricopeptide repeat protein [Nocardioides sp. T5]|uniref:tetratricopeptide repeat protein n=1 Tax=Nocardioides sp. T5 TaxID=3400182 RepID=UPI003A89EC3F
MTSTTYADLVGAHLADPTPETLEPLRDAVRAAPGFDPELRVREQADALLRDGRYDDAVIALEASMPGSLLSPAAHAMLATALKRSGRPDGAGRHARLARARPRRHPRHRRRHRRAPVVGPAHQRRVRRRGQPRHAAGGPGPAGRRVATDRPHRVPGRAHAPLRRHPGPRCRGPCLTNASSRRRRCCSR